MKSSDWWAKEKECSDSDGKRDRSSVKLGEAGPGDNGVCWPDGNIIDMEVGLARLVEGLRDDAAEFGRVGARIGWFWRILRRPDRPSPWSWSVMRGDLEAHRQYKSSNPFVITDSD